MKNTKEVFIENLRRFRKAKFPTQADFADALGMSTNGYQRYEQGAGEPGPEMIGKIAKVLGVKAWQLLADETSRSAVTPASLRDAVFLLESYQKAGPEERAIALSILTHDLAHLDPFDDADLSAALSPLKAL